MNYESIKKLAKKFIPTRFFHRNQALIRKMVALRYMGSHYECNICAFKLSKFVKLSTGDLLCPNCGSLPRTRRLWEILQAELKAGGKKVLHFSPMSAISKKLKNRENIIYITSDYNGDFDADKKLDIRKIDEPDEEYDLIICFHVLEHIPEDTEAIQELFRILRDGGKCLFQTPFKEGSIYENPIIQTPAERLQHFGQEDHVRIYSVEGLKERIKKEGFNVHILHYENCYDNRYGFKEKEVVIVGEKLIRPKC